MDFDSYLCDMSGEEEENFSDPFFESAELFDINDLYEKKGFHLLNASESPPLSGCQANVSYFHNNSKNSTTNAASGATNDAVLGIANGEPMSPLGQATTPVVMKLNATIPLQADIMVNYNCSFSEFMLQLKRVLSNPIKLNKQLVIFIHSLLKEKYPTQFRELSRDQIRNQMLIFEEFYQKREFFFDALKDQENCVKIVKFNKESKEKKSSSSK